MNISQLLNSTNTFGGSRSTKGIFRDKKFGGIYVNNKEVYFDVKNNAVTISMYFNAETQKDINMHRATIVLKDVKQEFVKSSDIKNFLIRELGYKRLYDLIDDDVKKKINTNQFETSNIYKDARWYIEDKTVPQDVQNYVRPEDLQDTDETIYYDKLLKQFDDLRKLQGKRIDEAINYIEKKENVLLSQNAIDHLMKAFKNRQEDIIEKFLGLTDPEFLKDYKELNKRQLDIAYEAGFKSKERLKTTNDISEIIKQTRNRIFTNLVNNNPKIIPNKLIIPAGSARKIKNLDGLYYERYILIDRKLPLTTECQVNCSCFTGDTRIQLANGMSLTLKDLENMTNFKVLAYNTEIGKYEYARALNCTKRQENAKIMKVTLADGTSIRVTPSHRFLTSECEWKSAQDLQVGEFLKFNDNYKGYEVHEQKTSSSTFIYLDPTQPGDYEFGELKFTHKPFYVGITTGAYVKIENERCREYLDKLADINEQPLMFKQYYHVDEHVALQLKEKLVNRIGTVEQGSVLVNNPVQVNDNYINKEDKCVEIINVEELEEREDVYCLTVEGLGNFTIQTNNGNIIVENCADYYWTFAWANYGKGVHYGSKPPVYMNTYLRGEAIRNPENTPGCCKHLVMFIALLMNSNGIEDIIGSGENILNTRASMVTDSMSCIKSKKISLYRKADLREKIIKMDEDLKEFRANARDLGRGTKQIISTLENGKYLERELKGQKSDEQLLKDIKYKEEIYDIRDVGSNQDKTRGRSYLQRPSKDHKISINKRSFRNMTNGEKRMNGIYKKFW